jgi:hypothetical protein
MFMAIFYRMSRRQKYYRRNQVQRTRDGVTVVCYAAPVVSVFRMGKARMRNVGYVNCLKREKNNEHKLLKDSRL